MKQMKYIQLNPVCNIFDEKKIWMRSAEAYLDFSDQIRWKTIYVPKKCYFKDYNITDIKDYGLDKFLNATSKSSIYSKRKRM